MISFTKLSSCLWDLCCIGGIVTIWPRFIEPELIEITRHRIAIDRLPEALERLTIVQLSDLHIDRTTSDRFLDKIAQKVHELDPAILVMTGDFLCHGQLSPHDRDRLLKFLNSLEALFGCYAILGNHDYANYLSINDQGDYDISPLKTTSVVRAFSRIFQGLTPTKTVTQAAQKTPVHQELCNLLKQTHWQLLHNSCVQVAMDPVAINIVGLGDRYAGRCLPEEAFKNHDAAFPTLVLSHNPDNIFQLAQYPGDLILSGHSHGSQVNLPWIRHRFGILENPQLSRGLHHVEGKKLYVNRGLGSPLPFRWFARPEITHFTLLGS